MYVHDVNRWRVLFVLLVSFCAACGGGSDETPVGAQDVLGDGDADALHAGADVFEAEDLVAPDPARTSRYALPGMRVIGSFEGSFDPRTLEGHIEMLAPGEKAVPGFREDLRQNRDEGDFSERRAGTLRFQQDTDRSFATLTPCQEFWVEGWTTYEEDGDWRFGYVDPPFREGFFAYLWSGNPGAAAVPDTPNKFCTEFIVRNDTGEDIEDLWILIDEFTLESARSFVDIAPRTAESATEPGVLERLQPDSEFGMFNYGRLLADVGTGDGEVARRQWMFYLGDTEPQAFRLRGRLVELFPERCDVAGDFNGDGFDNSGCGYAAGAGPCFRDEDCLSGSCAGGQVRACDGDGAWNEGDGEGCRDDVFFRRGTCGLSGIGDRCFEDTDCEAGQWCPFGDRDELEYSLCELLETPVVQVPPTGGQVTSFLSTTSALVDAEILSLGSPPDTQVGICIAPSPSTPGLADNCASLGTATFPGIFAHLFESLTPGEEYSVRAYGENPVGIGWSSVETFRTWIEPDVDVVDVTPSLGAVTASITASEVGNPTATAHGICVALDPGNLSDGCTDEGSWPGGASAGPYTISVGSPGSTIHIAAFAQNSAGLHIGPAQTFTAWDLPALGTVSVSAITSFSATTNVPIAQPGVPSNTVTRGFCFGTAPTPRPGTTPGGDCVAVPGDAGTSFGLDIAGLEPFTDYHVAGFLENEAGRAYSDDTTFRTAPLAPAIAIVQVEPSLGNVSVFLDIADLGVPTPPTLHICIAESELALPGNCVSVGPLFSTGPLGPLNLATGTPGATHYVVAEAINAEGMIGISTTESFTAFALPTFAPPTTSAPTTSSFDASAVIEDFGFPGNMISSSVCWGTSPEPRPGSTPGGDCSIPTFSGAQSALLAELSGLTPYTEYHVAFSATTSAGTAWSADVVRTTLPQQPGVNTPFATEVTFNSALLRGQQAAGVPAPTQARFRWRQSGGVWDTIAVPGFNGTMNNFQQTLAGLRWNTPYEYAAEVYHPAYGWVSGPTRTFTTQDFPAVLVSPSGTDITSCGVNPEATPCRTVSYAYARAGGLSRSEVWLLGTNSTVFTQGAALVLAGNRNVRGGLELDGIQIVENGQQPIFRVNNWNAVRADSLTGAVHLENVRIETTDRPNAATGQGGQANIALIVRNSTSNLRITNVHIRAGRGGRGGNGSNGLHGCPGQDGDAAASTTPGNGARAVPGSSPGCTSAGGSTWAGGQGGTSGGGGSNGGDGYCPPNRTGGTADCQVPGIQGGTGGTAGPCGEPGGNGQNGDDGVSLFLGTTGAGGSGLGSLTPSGSLASPADVYTPSAGNTGNFGSFGLSGGGGGGGAGGRMAVTCAITGIGGAGGGGGAGGYGGAPGTGGGGGGASVAALVINSLLVTTAGGNVFETVGGGNGGTGGGGGAGGAGGRGGFGAGPASGNGGSGGRGGDGGNGQRGGCGGGGGGGPSIGVWRAAGGDVSGTGRTFNVGPGGSGGNQGSNGCVIRPNDGGNGNNGISQNIRNP
ncbi:MAG: hypothetical protein EA398_09875 [Deltaproteobacteria bacterium]|nr:MAG: hypothetical protein EA398_09875 [Deltaproteobacteria bacterium]